jgi:hypothetical protein
MMQWNNNYYWKGWSFYGSLKKTVKTVMMTSRKETLDQLQGTRD